MPNPYSQSLKNNPVKVVAVPKSPTTKLALSIDANYKVKGRYSGREYLFNGAGSVQDVDNTDVEWMLGLRQGERQCCGGSERGNKVFVLA